MEQATRPDSDGRRVPQTMAALLEEIASLRKENEEQRRELQQLRGAAQVTVSLHQSDNPPQPAAMPRFKDFPYEIREMIWELALPRRLLGCEDLRQKHVVPTDLNVPALAQVCQEARNFATSKNHINGLPGAFQLLLLEEDEAPSPRLRDPKPACWTWFSPCTDTLLINPHGFRDKPVVYQSRVLARAAEHILIEDPSFWAGFQDTNQHWRETTDDLLKKFTDWVHHVYAKPCQDDSHCIDARVSACNLRSIDFAMRQVTKIDRTAPPQLLRCLFGEDNFRMVDLRDRDSASEILRMLGSELSRGMEPDDFFKWSGELADSLGIFEWASDQLFQHLEPALLKALVAASFEASNDEPSEGHRTLAAPFKSGGSELDMEVTWVKALSERLTVRPVHVFVLGEDGLED